MLGTIKIVRDRIQSFDRGRIFFIQDFIDLDSQGALRIALCDLVDEGMIRRLARGIYCYPRIVDDRIVLPSEESIAYALASKEKVRILPYGDLAAYQLGLTGMKISMNKYLTDGAPRKIKLYNGQTICFNHTSEVKIFSFKNDTMYQLSAAIRTLGSEAIGALQLNTMREALRSVSEADFKSDISIPPSWVQELLLELWNR